MENINLDNINLDNINVEDIVDKAGKLVSNGTINIPVAEVAKIGLAMSAGALLAVGASKFVIPKFKDKLPEPGILSRKNKIVDVECEEVTEEEKDKTKKDTKKK